MYRPQNLRIPGPTFVPQAVLAASARPLINHRGPEFAALLAALTRALQDFLRTEHDVLLLTASGSGGMEAAIANTLSSGDKVLVFSCGAFGERFAAICKSYGVDARRVDVPYGRAVGTYKASLESAQTPATPAVTVFIALQESLRLMAEEGLEAIIRRHRDLARATRRGLQAVNLQLFADERYASPAVTAFRPPARVDARNLIRILRDDHDTIVAGGQGKMEGQLVRVAHLGFVTLQDIVAFFSALELTLRDLNQPVEPGVAISATLRAYAEGASPPAARPAARAAARPPADAVATRR